jgi:hypothetical protein
VGLSQRSLSQNGKAGGERVHVSKTGT